MALLDYPRELIADLSRCIDPLWAEEKSWELAAGRLAVWGKSEAVQQRIKSLIDRAQPHEEMPVTLVAPQNAAWFAANGIPYKIIDA